MIPLLLALAFLAAPSAAAPDEPPDFGRFAVWASGGDRILLDLPALGIARGLYGPAQARALLTAAALRRRAARMLEFREVPLPNIYGRLRLFIARTASPTGDRQLVFVAYFARTGTGPAPGTGPYHLDGWSLVRLGQAGSP